MYAHDLSILTVSYYHEKHILLNLELVKKLNEALPSSWLVVLNAPEEEKGLQSNDFLSTVPGIPKEDLPIQHISVHHGYALNKGLRHIKSRFLLVLDPDFYIIAPNWINDVLSMMVENNLSFFGSPWHPQSTSKPRYFPAPHCMFVDLDKINIEQLDFVPTLGEARIAQRSSKSLVQQFTRGLKKQLPESFQRRWQIGRGSDTGELIHKQYSSNVEECRTLQPIFNPEETTLRHSGKPVDIKPYDGLLDRILPDRLSYIPKKKEYFTSRIPPDFAPVGQFVPECECFVWNGSAFGIHHRGCLPSKTSREEVFEGFKQALRAHFDF